MKEYCVPSIIIYARIIKTCFSKSQDKETKELKASIKFKAIESYIMLEKQIFPLCDCDLERPYKIELIVVIDEEEIEDYENTLYELSSEKIPSNADKNNIFHSLKESLKNYCDQKDKQSPPNDYFYDKIQVLSAKKFEKFFIDLFFQKFIKYQTALSRTRLKSH